VKIFFEFKFVRVFATISESISNPELYLNQSTVSRLFNLIFCKFSMCKGKNWKENVLLTLVLKNVQIRIEMYQSHTWDQLNDTDELVLLIAD